MSADDTAGLLTTRAMRAAAPLLLLLTGCASMIAGSIGTDLSTLHFGATRQEVQRKLGSGKETKGANGRTEVAYSFTPTDPRDAKRAKKYASFEDFTYSVSTFGPYSYTTSSGKSGRGFLGTLIAVPLMAVEGVMTVREAVRAATRKRGRITVVYQDDVVVDYVVKHPPPP